MAKLKPFRGDYYLWKYLPSIPLAAVFAVLFLVATSAIVWRLWRTRSWFCTVFATGGLFQVIGYATRIAAHNNTAKIMSYAIQNAFMLYGVSGLIMARSVFRLDEFIMGMDGYLLSNEWPLYVFDSVPMLAVMVIFWEWFPSMAVDASLRSSSGEPLNVLPSRGHTATSVEEGWHPKSGYR
ncbi:hypothetical protein ACHAQH_006081 [Verticillium albo-atrum]